MGPLSWISRRTLLASAAGAAALRPARAHAKDASRAEPLALASVRLKPSIFLDAVNANRAQVFSLSPDRLLHNFRKGAGLEPRGELYGGWEARGIAGHTLGHYLSACALLYAQTGDEEARARVRYVVGELAACQQARGDGYVGGTTVERGGAIVDGKIVYEEVRRGLIESNGFGLNGGWVPLYAWHKVHAGLLDAHRLCADAEPLQIARAMGDHLLGVFAALDDNQVQRVLACEHGGINETFAELHARTGDARYLGLARRLYHRAVLDPLADGRDELRGLHANTQIPKVIGLARLYELTGEAGYGRAAQFFWNAVTRHHSYVIGGNSEREHFSAPGAGASLLTDRTCEACNTYNMLRLTRHLWAWHQTSAYFDYFERAHLNHIMAHQHPRTGMKAYFMPMTIGGRRQYSTPDDSFWCCLGSGMESHAKHGESIFWRTRDTLFVNLFIPATLDWRERGAALDLETAFPHGETVALTVTEAGRDGRFAIALRLPAWCAAPELSLNGRALAFERRDGYALVRRRWRDGDRLELALPMDPRIEPTSGDPRAFAFLSGPIVLAADLGEAARPLATPRPALFASDAAPQLERIEGGSHVYRLRAHSGALTLRPYFEQYDRRTAPYLAQLTEAEWAERKAAFAAGEEARAALDARTVDRIELGEAASETAHAYRANHDDLFSYEGVAGRQAPWGVGNYFEFELAIEPGPLSLHALYWGEEINKDFEIRIDGATLVRERRPGPAVRSFVAQEYTLPRALTRGKSRIAVRFETRGTDALVYGVRVLRAA
jgi:DUF1680 family protein